MTNPFALDTPATAPAAPATAPATPSPATTAPFGPSSSTVTAPAAPTATVDTSDPFDAPAPQESKGPRMRDLYGRLLLIVPHKLEEGLVSRFSKPDKPQYEDRMTADVVVLDGGTIHYGGAPEKTPPTPHTQTAEVPYKRNKMFISAVGVISQCRFALAKKVTEGKPGMVLGRLSVGEAKDNNNPPYLLTPATDADKAIARAYLANVDPFA